MGLWRTVIVGLGLAFGVAGCRGSGTEQSQRPVTPSEWKSVIRDYYDGRIDQWHRCDAVREARRRIPQDLIYTDIYDVFDTYAEAVCSRRKRGYLRGTAYVFDLSASTDPTL
jgi:hypothetical protein